MTPPGANPYLRTKILTANPEELRLMLYEGAIRFCRQAKTALAAKELEASYNALMRAQKIVLELSTSLNHTVDPELCTKLTGLYTFIYRRIVDANLHRDAAIIQEVISLLEYEKETWQLLMKKLAESQADPRNPQTLQNPRGAQQTALSTVNG